MTVRPIDTASAGLAADGQLASAIMTYIADTANAAQVEATRSCGAAYNYNHPPLLHSMPWGSDTGGDGDFRDPAADPAVMLFLWRAGERADYLTVTMRSTLMVGSSDTVSLYILPLDEWLRQRRLPPAVDTAAHSSGERTIMLVTSDMTLSPGVMYAVLIGLTSSLSTTREAWYDSSALDGGGAPTGGTALVGWDDSRFNAGQASTFWWDGTTMTPHADLTEPYLVEVANGATGLTAYWSEGGKSTSTHPQPLGRLSQRQDAAFALESAYDVIHVWPPIPDNDQEGHRYVAPGATDWIVRTALSYAKVHGVTIRETERALLGYGTIMEPERPTDFRAAWVLNNPVLASVERRQRVWAIAPPATLVSAQLDNAASADDSARSGGAVGYRSVAHPRTLVTASGSELFRVELGEPHEWEDDGVSYAQARYRVFMLLMLIGYDDRPHLRRRVNMKFQMSDLDGTNTTTQVSRVQDIPLMTLTGANSQRASAPYWWGLGDKTATGVIRYSPFRHSGQSLWPLQVQRDPALAYHPMELDVIDAAAYATDRTRRMICTCEFEDALAPLQYLFLQALHIESVPGFGPTTSVEL